MKAKTCPSCSQAVESEWAWLYAHWPFSVRCQQCHARLRVKRNWWLDALCQTTSSVVVLIVIVAGVMGGNGSLLWLLPIGVVIAFAIAALPGLLGRYVEVGKG